MRNSNFFVFPKFDSSSSVYMQSAALIPPFTVSVGLTGDKLFDLSEKITNQSSLGRLTIRGLGMQFHEVDKFIENYSNDITTAAYKLLTKWYTSQTNNVTALDNLCEALRKADLNALIDELQ